jgi:hypothetical protein
MLHHIMPENRIISYLQLIDGKGYLIFEGIDLEIIFKHKLQIERLCNVKFQV